MYVELLQMVVAMALHVGGSVYCCVRLFGCDSKDVMTNWLHALS